MVVQLRALVWGVVLNLAAWSAHGQAVQTIPPGTRLANCTASSAAPGQCKSDYAGVLYAIDYGVTANGTTDDTSAMNAAATAACSAGKSLELPAGFIEVTASSSSGAIPVTCLLRVRGQGIDVTKVRLKAGSTGPAFYVNVPSSAVGSGLTGDVTFTDLTVTADSSTDTPGQSVAHGIALAPTGSTATIRVEGLRVKVTQMPADGINATTFSGWFNCYECFIVYNGGRGLYANSVTDWRWEGAEIGGNQSDGMVWAGDSGMYISKTNFYVNGQSGTGSNINVYETTNSDITESVSDLTFQTGIQMCLSVGQTFRISDTTMKWSSSNANATYSDLNLPNGCGGTVLLTSDYFGTPASSTSSNKPLNNINFVTGTTAVVQTANTVFQLGSNVAVTGITNRPTSVTTVMPGPTSVITAQQFTGFCVNNGTNNIACLTGITGTDDNGVLSLSYAGTTGVQLSANTANAQNYINNPLYLGNGSTNASPVGQAIQATGGSGGNVAGGNLTVAGGQGTGSGAGGTILLKTAPAGSSGSSANALTTAATIGAGIQVGAPNGADEGGGTVNAANGLYVGGMKVPFTIAQGGVPLILPSSGSMANNGVLTLATALAVTYANAYFYMPAGAIASGSAAGLYFGQCTSATACTLFNNTYTSGVATVPAAPVAFSTTGPGAYTQTTGSYISLGQGTLPANSLGPNGQIDSEAVVVTPNNANAKSLEYEFGGNLLQNFSLASQSSTHQSMSTANQGVVGTQVTTPGTLGSIGIGTTTRSSVSTSSSVAVQLLVQLATATDYAVFEHWKMTVYPQ
jgi:hypothetical protein